MLGGQYWESIGKIQGRYWGEYREDTGEILGEYWEDTEGTLGQYWGILVATHMRLLGEILRPSRNQVTWGWGKLAMRGARMTAASPWDTLCCVSLSSKLPMSAEHVGELHQLGTQRDPSPAGRGLEMTGMGSPQRHNRATLGSALPSSQEPSSQQPELINPITPREHAVGAARRAQPWHRSPIPTGRSTAQPWLRTHGSGTAALHS